MSRVVPNPGSEEAIKKGCKCPVLDNAHGKGIGDGRFWYSAECDFHNQYPIVKDTSPTQPGASNAKQ